MTPVIQLSRPQWLVVAAFVAVVFPLLVILVVAPTLSNWIVEETLAPGLERDLGFTAVVATHPTFGGADTFFIADVQPGGAFDRAGVRAGDIPKEVHHGRSDFYRLLEGHRGKPVEVRFLRQAGSPPGASLVEHRVTIIVPRSAG